MVRLKKVDRLVVNAHQSFQSSQSIVQEHDIFHNFPVTQSCQNHLLGAKEVAINRLAPNLRSEMSGMKVKRSSSTDWPEVQ